MIKLNCPNCNNNIPQSDFLGTYVARCKTCGLKLVSENYRTIAILHSISMIFMLVGAAWYMKSDFYENPIIFQNFLIIVILGGPFISTMIYAFKTTKKLKVK